MKHIIMLLALLIFSLSPGFSQKFYIQASGGYAFGFLKDPYHGESSYGKIRADSMYDETFEGKNYPFSLGTGGQFSLSVGCQVGNHIAIELAGFYNPTKSLKFETTDYYYFPVGGYYFDYNVTHTFKGSTFGFIPAIQFRIGQGSVKPYGRIGVIFAFNSMTYDYKGDYFTTHPYYYPTSHESYTLEYKRNLNVGIEAAAGVDIYLADRLSLFVEANGRFISFIPGKAEYTSYIVNGEDCLDELTVYEREIELVSSYETTDNPPQNEPRKELRESFSFSSLGLSAGIRFNFFK